MGEGIIVDSMPITTHECTHEEKQCGLGLVEVSNQLVNNAEGVAWLDHDLGFSMQDVLVGLL